MSFGLVFARMNADFQFWKNFLKTMSFFTWGIQIWSGVTVSAERLSRTGEARLVVQNAIPDLLGNFLISQEKFAIRKFTPAWRKTLLVKVEPAFSFTQRIQLIPKYGLLNKFTRRNSISWLFFVQEFHWLNFCLWYNHPFESFSFTLLVSRLAYQQNFNSFYPIGVLHF